MEHPPSQKIYNNRLRVQLDDASYAYYVNGICQAQLRIIDLYDNKDVISYETT